MATNENLPPNVIKHLAKELKNLDETPPEGIKIIINDDDFSTIFADIEGPAGTPYENGMFRMMLLLSHDFPQSPPKGSFLTKIFHPNIATNGEICVNTLKKDWNPSLGLCHVLLVVRCLLIEPFPESALNEQAGKMLLEDYEEYARLARIYTDIHALRPKKPKTQVISECTTTVNVDLTISHSVARMQLPGNPLAASTVSMSLGGKSHEQDQPTVSKETRPDANVTKKAPLVPVKSQVDKRKMDARKRSLRRL